ncbi:MAG: hypothetical protein LUE93_09025, partial [Bacteroides sp.]|nr:hypothetical protein [Bacteroides sp.]
MDQFDLKVMWQTGAEKAVTGYSESELQKIVVKSVRHSTLKLFPWVSLGLLPFIFSYFIWKIAAGRQPAGVTLLQIGIILFVTGILVWAGWVWKRKSRFKADRPLKEWLGEQISYMEEQMNFRKKYKYLLLIVSCSTGIGVGIFYTWLDSGSIPWQVTPLIIVIIVAYIYISDIIFM